MSTEMVVRGDPDAMQEYSVTDVVAQVQKIQQIMAQVMRQDEHYGVIPGCKKPSLLKPGAEKLGFTFRLVPRFHGEREAIDLGNAHREYVIRCELYHLQSGMFFGEGVGSCCTMEAKYRYRTGPKEFTGQPVPGSYWNLRKTDPIQAQQAIGGAGFSVGKNDSGVWEICIQGEKVEHDNPADHYNTVLKMAKKRAHVDAVLTATAASDIFTQDLEDLAENGIHVGNGELSQKPEQPPVQQPKRKSETEPAEAPICPKCNSTAKLIPEGIAKTGKNAGKKYSPFYACQNQKCKYTWRPEKVEPQAMKQTWGEGADPDPMLEREPGQEG